MLHRTFRSFASLSLISAVGAAAACSAGDLSPGQGGTGASVNNDGVGAASSGGGLNVGNGGSGAGINVGNGGSGINPGNNGAFPAEPIIEGVDAATVQAFEGNPAVGSGICIFEPHLSDSKGPGALYPQNWLRPRFRWEGDGTAWEIKLEAPGQNNVLRVYTTQKQWLMPKDLWDTIAAGVQDTEITVTIRSNTGAGATGGTFKITGALAGGSMVFWGTKTSVVEPGASKLYGFTVGDEAVVSTLDTEQVTGIDRVYNPKGTDLRGELMGDDGKGDYIAGFEIGKARCIGCHSSTPDGKAMIFTDDYPWNMGIASVEAGTTGTPPAYVTPQARQFLKMPFLGTGMMLPAAWASGDRTLITTMGRRSDSSSPYMYINYGYGSPMTFEPDKHDLIWIDLQTTVTVSDTLPPATGDATGAAPWPVYYTGEERIAEAADRGDELLAAEGKAWGVLLTEGNLSISNPTPAKLSNRIAYSVSESSLDGHPDWHNNTADIKIADITNPKGTATGAALQGASDPTVLEYYPAFSPDDAFVAFNRAPTPSDSTRCAQGKQVDRTADPNGGPALCNNFTKNLGANPDGPYYNRNGEIWVVSSLGGTPHRVRGNDPVECSGEASPGVLNSWPKWSSAVRDHNGKLYYFVIFSSARAYPNQFELEPTDFTPPIQTKSSQLYMSTIEFDPTTGAMTSYGAIYLWNQNYEGFSDGTYAPLATANMTPAWEDFTIPEVPPTIVVK